MKRFFGYRKAWYLSIFLLFTSFCTGLAQEKIKFGEVPLSDLSMTVYPDDTTAIAVTLHEECVVRYDIVQNDFQVKTYHTIRMKVLKPAGLDKANISIHFIRETLLIRVNGFLASTATPTT